jgi:hypothetical protein
MSAASKLETEVILQDTVPDLQREVLLERALWEARALQERAEAMYAASGDEK